MKKGRRMLALLLAVVTIATSNLYFTMSAYGADNDGTVAASAIDDMKEQNGEGTEESELEETELEETESEGIEEPGNVSDSTNLEEGTEGSAVGEQSMVQENSLMQNQLKDSAVGFKSEIKKQVSAGNSDWQASVAAEKSLLEEDYTAEFLLNGYADGSNDIGASNFTVTDNQITMQKLNGTAYETIESTDKDYKIDAVTVKRAYNDKGDQEVDAQIYIQKTLEDKENNKWEKYGEIIPGSSLGTGSEIEVAFPDEYKVIGVKVEYQNVNAKFKSEGIKLQVTFLNRSGWSGVTDNEVRRIINTAQLDWTSKKVDESGKAVGDTASVDSNEVYITLPPYKENLPEVSITNNIVNKKENYYSGDVIQYEVEAENHKVDGKNDDFKSPVISFRMPAMTSVRTSLNSNGYVNGFLITLVKEDGAETVIPAESYRLETTTISAPLVDLGNDEYTESDKLKSTQYIFNFNKDIKLAPGDKIKINYSALISYEAKKDNGVTQLVSPAYLSSTKKAAVSAENQLGLSFIPWTGAGNQKLHKNEIIDKKLGDELEYLNATTSAMVSDSTVMQLIKYIGIKNKEGEIVWSFPGEVVQLNPNQTYYYKLQLLNNSNDNITSARIVDILPFNGDTYVMAASNGFTDRGTTIPSGEGYEDVTVQEIKTSDDKLSVYSTSVPWDARISSTEQSSGGILAMMYNRKNTFAANTNWQIGEGDKPTALGFEIVFGTGESALRQGSSYDIIFSAKAPGYTADKIGDYAGKVIENSAMASVTREGKESPTVELGDRMEPEKVTAKMALPTGSIGDYVWFDHNNNGIQDTKEEGDEPAENITVTLYKKTHTMLDDILYEKEEAVATTTTNQDGWYQFDGLACKYLKDGAEKDSTNPKDYVGGEYYEYRVQFDIAGYTATTRYAGADSAKDSNIDAKGYTEYITLSVKDGENGTLTGEENMTMDAGLVSPYAIGDYVWLDRNNNGLQEDDEKGVEGAAVLLYRVGSDGKPEDTWYKRTETDKDGKYLFENLIQGEYVVEFDISNLKKEDGHTYQYDFTIAGEEVDNSHSDAKVPVDADGKIKRTDTITLTKEVMEKAAGNPGVDGNRDLRWDAGLMVYSALGGFCFDDQDYNDIHTLNIPLAGTKVTLYEKAENGIGTKIGETTVGADGRYYFDHLLFPGETQDYLIRFDYPEGYTGVDSNVGSDDTLDSDAVYDNTYWDWDAEGLDGRKSGYAEVTLKKDTVDTTWDAGARKYSAVGDYVWEDENKDGRQDEGETPVPGVKVVLQSREGDTGEWSDYAVTETDQYGRYLFTNVKSSDRIANQYRVVFAVDKKTKVTTCQQLGVSDAENSDAINTYQQDIVKGTEDNPITGGYVTRMLKPGYGETDFTLDAGIYKPKVRVVTRTRNQVVRRVIRSGSTRTGDDAPVALIILLLILSGGGAGFLVYRRKKNKKS